ncbi:MAG TPA: LLM class flavin-dependent oxidoreductase [Candidatus Binataceae bacterium]|nr:LLM class flavin-dependent oxidoreductase [Candidatus Binataceae bacterium]
MALELSCAFATSSESHEHARIAEELGYTRAWFYDSPALYPDVWVQLCRAAERTSRIGLGPGVLVPSLRHPMVNAAAIATLASIAGARRVAVAIGSGFTGRLTMGKRPMKWSAVREYVQVLRALLRGDEAQWEGAAIRMLHPQGYGASRPIEVPIIIGAAGPKGIAVARELGDGVFGAPAPIPGFKWSITLTFGTVLREGEDPGSARVLASAGHAASVLFHFALENKMLPIVERGQEWAAAYEDVPSHLRHLALHDQHLIAINERDRPFVTGAMLAKQGIALTPAGWRERAAALEAAGATEIAYQPAGPNIPSELEAFASAIRG